MLPAPPPPPFQIVTPSQARQAVDCRRFQTVTPGKRMTVRNRLKPAENLGCDGVTAWIASVLGEGTIDAGFALAAVYVTTRVPDMRSSRRGHKAVEVAQRDATGDGRAEACTAEACFSRPQQQAGVFGSVEVGATCSFSSSHGVGDCGSNINLGADEAALDGFAPCSAACATFRGRADDEEDHGKLARVAVQDRELLLHGRRAWGSGCRRRSLRWRSLGRLSPSWGCQLQAGRHHQRAHTMLAICMAQHGAHAHAGAGIRQMEASF